MSGPTAGDGSQPYPGWTGVEKIVVSATMTTQEYEAQCAYADLLDSLAPTPAELDQMFTRLIRDTGANPP